MEHLSVEEKWSEPNFLNLRAQAILNTICYRTAFKNSKTWTPEILVYVGPSS